MIVNDLPSWVPIFNMVAAVTALVLAVPGLFALGWIAAYRAALGVSLVILLSGAMFQANIMPLWAWVVFGSGGRLLLLAIVVVGTVVAVRRPQRTHQVTLDDIAAQLREIERLAAVSSEHAEAAYTAASDADDRVMSQSERAVDDRARVVRVEETGRDTNERAQDIQERLP